MRDIWEKYWLFIPFLSLFFVTLVAIIKSISLFRNSTEKKYFKLILFFFVITFLQMLIGAADIFFIDPVDKVKGKNSVSNISVFIYAFIEYQIYVYLLIIFIKSSKIKGYLKNFRVLMFLLAFILWFSSLSYIQVMSYYTLAEALTIFPACLFFFYEILSGPPILQLNKEPSFWIVTGIIFLFVCLVPTYIGIAILNDFHSIDIMDYIGYILITILFLKGITCKTAQVV